MAVLNNRFKTILLTGFIAGTLDILSAIFLLGGGNAAGVLRYVAKGALGNAALEGGSEMIFFGLLFHYIIAFSFTIGYFMVYPHLKILHRSPILSGLFYGLFVWTFMQYVVLPFTSNAPAGSDLTRALKNIGILMYAIGLPIAWFAHRYYIHSKTE